MSQREEGERGERERGTMILNVQHLSRTILSSHCFYSGKRTSLLLVMIIKVPLALST